MADGKENWQTYQIAILEPRELGGALVLVDGVVVGHDALAVHGGLFGS